MSLCSSLQSLLYATVDLGSAYFVAGGSPTSCLTLAQTNAVVVAEIVVVATQIVDLVLLLNTCSHFGQFLVLSVLPSPSHEVQCSCCM